ncbi:hypothetical protein ACFOOM_33710 [Streptomyces echinoruber]|uniref:hypothetical protein n=1 Tax=Streptomyces echinoruber TaxID=68898 RepID=UPI00167D93B3|nr:hypothetical protein [Streptomyces echinoruber]
MRILLARAQLGRLLDMSEHDTVTALMIPFGQTGFPAAGQPITYAHGLDRMESSAPPEPKSRDLIHRIARDL